jgi:hypothetical protein
MSISRRMILKAGAAISAAVTLPAIASAKAPIVAIYDSRILESRSFAETLDHALLIDVAAQDDQNWVGLRKGLQGTRQIKGLTGWTDWVNVRGLLEERGLRLTSQTSVPAPLSGKAHLFKWEMRA